MVSTCCKVTYVVVLFAALLAGIFLLTVFPLAIYPAAVKAQLKLSTDEDGQPSKITSYWENLPAHVYYNFYMFGVTNIDSAMHYGEKMAVYDKGPYKWREWESKTATFSEDKEHVNYTNHKYWSFEGAVSCDLCKADDVFWQPSLSLMATGSIMLQTTNLTSIQKMLTNVGTLMLGVGAYTPVTMENSLFLGYSDPLIDLVNSRLVAELDRIVNGSIFGFNTPKIKSLGFFPAYNGTNDENYSANTGKSDYTKIGAIETWANSSSLGWWKSFDANDVTGASDGSYWGGLLDKSDTLKNFQSFICRHLEMNYADETTYDGMNAWVYRFSDNIFDTRYPENVGYAPDNLLNKTYVQGYNFLDSAGNVAFPPGVIEQKCFPGQARRVPFLAMLSHPHFYNSPPELLNSVVGLSPQADLHDMGEFVIQPTVGSTLSANLRFQFNVPIFNAPEFISLTSVLSTVVPCFWLDTEVTIKDYARDYIKTNTVTIPLSVLIVGICLTALSVLVAVTVAAVIWGKQRRRNRLAQNWETKF